MILLSSPTRPLTRLPPPPTPSPPSPTPDDFSAGFQPFRGVGQKRLRWSFHGLPEAGHSFRAPDGGEPDPSGAGQKGLRRRRRRRPPPRLVGAAVLRPVEERRLGRRCWRCWRVQSAEDVEGRRWGRRSGDEKGTGCWRWGRRRWGRGCARGQGGELCTYVSFTWWIAFWLRRVG